MASWPARSGEIRNVLGGRPDLALGVGTGCGVVTPPAAPGEVCTYPTFTSGLEALADWLTAEGVTQVVMEATGRY